ncbi:uncharacterized protein ACNS7B_012818 isoform 5-T7 [Menidia menidia]
MYTKSVQPGISLCQQVKHIEGKGRGVFAIKGFKKGEYVVEYHGDLLDLSQAKMREAEYAEDPQTGCYMYYFQYQSKTYCEIRGDVQRPQLRGRAAGRGQEEEELRGTQRAEELPCQAGSQQPSRQQLRGGRGPAGGPGEEKTSEEEHKEEPQGQGVGAEER